MLAVNRSSTDAYYALKRVGLDNEEKDQILAKILRYGFIKLVETPLDANEVFFRLQRLLFSQHAFELEKWMSFNEALAAAIFKELKWMSRTNQFGVEQHTEGYAVSGLHWSVTYDSLQACKTTNKEVATSFSQKKQTQYCLYLSILFQIQERVRKCQLETWLY